MLRRSEGKVLGANRERLTDPGARVIEEQDKRVIAPSSSGGLIGLGKEELDVFRLQRIIHTAPARGYVAKAGRLRFTEALSATSRAASSVTPCELWRVHTALQVSTNVDTPR